MRRSSPDGNEVTVFEKREAAGGAFRYAGKAPLFQEVAASERSFERYIADLVAACTRKGVAFRFETDVTRQPELLAPFDRIVIATGARYRFGLGPVATTHARLGRRPLAGLCAALFACRRCATGSITAPGAERADRFKALAKPGQTVVAIGDAVAAGKSKPAIASAFEAALLA